MPHALFYTQSCDEKVSAVNETIGLAVQTQYLLTRKNP